MISILVKLIGDLRPKDYLEASGPLIIIVVFGCVLYAIKAGHNQVVQLSMGLIFWPLYQFIGLLVENSLMNFLRAIKTKQEHDYLMALGPLLLLVGLMSLFNYSHWFWMVLFAQLLPLLFNPLSSWDQDKGCLFAMFTVILLFIVFMLVMFGAQETLSKSYHLPYAEGGFKFLPGMLIIGIGYYLLSAILAVLMRPFMRGAAISK